MRRLESGKLSLCCLVLAFYASQTLTADEPATPASEATDPPAGHSLHGETFNEGPRQRAELIPGTGRVHLEISTKVPESQQFFDQGLGQLHGFWYLEAERSFRQAALLDPECAMNYWGMVQANINNQKRAKGFLTEAMKHRDKASPREQKYLDACNDFYNGSEQDAKKRAENYAKALEKLVYEFPSEIEAKALLGLQLYQNKSKGVPIQSYLAVDALLHDILTANPLHPCHHYLIHLWDNEKPERALPSAALCGEAAPGIAHMWHMPGHIYSKLKRYEDAVWQQEASARVDHAHMIRYGMLPDEIHNFAHNNEWLIRNLIHIGRAGDAVDLARNMIELPRHPKWNSLKKGSSNFGRMRLFDTLAEFELWGEVIELAHTRYLEPTADDSEQVKRLRSLGRAYLRTQQTTEGEAALADLERRLTTFEQEKAKAVEAAKEKATSEKKDEKEITAAGDKAAGTFSGRINSAKQAVEELRGLLALGRGDGRGALEAFKQAGSVNALWKAEAHRSAGELDEGIKLLIKEVESNSQETIPLANLAWFLHDSGRTAEALSHFDKLREISSSLDLSAPPFARLHELADLEGLSVDWRKPLERASDFGTRPELESLGPFRWTPPAAPSFTLKDVAGRDVRLEDYRGKPVVVIFYLGFGCLHCVEQLQSFAPQAAEFERQGIALLAVSTDTPVDLHRAIDNYDGRFPIRLVSNSDLDVFKAYRSFDDFESQPLHGTFLIDADGKVRWRDISYEPFNNPQFVLEEAQRLLHLEDRVEFETVQPLVAPRPMPEPSSAVTAGD